MKTNMQQKSFSIKGVGCCVLTLLLAIVLSGCGNSGGGSSSTSTASPAKAAKLSGIVLNINGPVEYGVVEVTDAKKAVVATAQLNNSNRYTLTVPATAAYPIVLTAKPQGGGAEVRAVVTSSMAEKMDISTVSTLVVDNAIQMGGLTQENISKASFGAIGQRQSAGVSAGAGGTTGGAGNSGGGIGRGGHGGHDMAGMGGGSVENTEDGDTMMKMKH